MDNSITEFSFVTRDNSGVEGKSRIYFSCHANDKYKYFQSICKDIFSLMDCVIFYTDNMEAEYSEDVKNYDLMRMNLFVIPVTRDLLFSENRVINVDLPFAQQNDIPILPLMMDNSLIFRYEEVFGKIQYLTPRKFDETAIPYIQKLKIYLTTTLISDELRKKVQEAFDEYVFLSYRKKDRAYANELMRLIHINPRFRRLAIWYDEYLVPGERYDDLIKNAMETSSIFTLLVTPNLLEDNNYVLTTEYPYAKELFDMVLPIEMVSTDRKALEESYPGIPDIIQGKDDKELRDAFIDALKAIAHKESKDDPIHNYMLGIAYLEGIDVEIDREYAVSYIESAAKDNLPEAVSKLARLYHDGIGVDTDWNKWLTLLEKSYSLLCENKADDRSLSETCFELANAYDEMGRFPDSLDYWNKVYEFQRSVYTEDSKELMATLGKLSIAYQNIGEISKAKEINTDLYERQLRLYGDMCADTLLTMARLSKNYLYLGDYSKAYDILRDANGKLRSVLGDDNPTVIEVRTAFYDLCFFDKQYYYVSEMYYQRYLQMKDCFGEDYPLTLIIRAKELLSRFFDFNDEAILFTELAPVYNRIKSVLGGDDHPMVIDIEYYVGIAMAYCDWQLARNLLETTVEKRKRIYGEYHPETKNAIESLTMFYKIEKGEKSFSFDLLMPKHL